MKCRVVGTAGVMSGVLVFALITVLAVPASAQAPSLTVAPSDNLREGQVVHLTASGLSVGPYSVYECIIFYQTPRLADFCDLLGALRPHSGEASGVVRVTQDIGAPQSSDYGTWEDTCQLALVFPHYCEIAIGSDITTDSVGRLVGVEAESLVRFKPAVTASSGTYTDGQIATVNVAPPDPAHGMITVAQCALGYPADTCETLAAAPAHGRSNLTFQVPVSRYVNGEYCNPSAPYNYCLLVAGTGDIGTPNANIFGAARIYVTP